MKKILLIFIFSLFASNNLLAESFKIDVENSRILIVNSLHYNNTKYKYNHKKLILDPFKNGKQIN